MKVLVACEWSGTVRDAFLAAGHDAMSCDLLPTESEGPHYQGDVRDVLSESWDLIVAHPPCTRLCLSGLRWLDERDLWGDLDEAAEFFRLFSEHPAERVAVENPIPHRHAVERIGRKYDQIVQPWQFGEAETKAVCLWLKGLPPLIASEVVQNAEPKVHKMSQSPGRAKERSRFFKGIARAMAAQWGRPAQ